MRPSRAIRGGCSALFVLGLLGAAPAPAIDGPLAGLLADLDLSEISDGSDLAITWPTTAPAPWPTFGAALAEHLRERGLRILLQDGDAAALVRAGAEWRLELVPTSSARGRVILSELDPGLWPRPPRASRTFEVNFDGAPPPPPPPSTDPPPNAATARLGPGQPLGLVPGPIWALAACGPRSGPERLFALTPDRLLALKVEQGRFETLAELPLSETPRAEAPTRAPLAQITCGARAESQVVLGLGHGRRASGWLVSYEESGKKARLRIVAEVPGIPLEARGDEWRLGRADQGRGRYGAWLWWSPKVAPAPEPRSMAAPQWAIAAVLDDAGASTGLVGLSVGRGLGDLDQDLRGAAPGVPSGLGFSARHVGGRRLLLITSDRRDGERIGLAPGEMRAIDHPVRASALLAFLPGRYAAVWAEDRGDRGTALISAALELP